MTIKHNRLQHFSRLLCGIVLLCLAACQGKRESSGSEILYNFRSVDITPDEPVLLAGFANREGASASIHRRLKSSAMVVKQDSAMACMIFNDLMELAPEYVTEIKEKITQQTGLHGQYIFIMQSHSHSAPIMDGMGLGWSDANKRYLHSTIDSIADNAIAVITGTASFVPAAFKIGTGTCNINTNRRSVDPETGEAVIGKSEDGNCDKTVKVLQVTDKEGNTLNTIFNYACHPVTLGYKSRAVSSDFAGSAEEVVARHFGGQALLMTGASGDVNPVNGLSANPAVADTEGAKLGDAVNSATFITDSIGNGLKVYNLAVDLPYRDTGITAAFIDEQVKIKSAQKTEFIHWQKDVATWGGIMKKQLAEKGRLPAVRHMQLGALKVGSTVIVFTQGEFFNSYQVKLRNKFPGVDILFAGYTNGEAGYVPDGAAFALKGYEVDQAYIYLREPSPLKPETEKILDAALEEAVRKVL